MTEIILFVPAFILLVCSVLFLVRAWRTGRFSMPDRLAALCELLGVTALFALSLSLVDWRSIPGLLWVVSVALVAAGVSGLVVRWPARGWIAPRKHRAWRWIRLAVGITACTSTIALALA